MKKLFKLNEKLIIIDIGANIGSISLPLAKIFNKSKIFAIEPTNYAFKKLTKNLNLNKDLKKNISLNQVFLSKKTNPQRFGLVGTLIIAIINTNNTLGHYILLKKNLTCP